ncbi:MAG: HAMP domain-containing sensor histidine kinase [Microgenomates group bacterium]
MFKTARIRLTAWYIIILMSVSIAFSVAIFRGMSVEVERFAYLQRIRVERRFDELRIPRPEFVDDEIIQEAKQHIIIVLLGINGIILIVMGGISYVLAGTTLEPIQTMMEEQDRFVSDASHELKTPLTIMKSELEVYVRDPKLTLPEAKKVLKDNIEEVNRLQKLSESLLTLLEHDSKTVQKTFKKIKMNIPIENALKLVRHNAIEKNITIKIKNTLQKATWGNEDRLRELFIIILDNAIKYSQTNGQITISTGFVRRQIEIRIVDSGIGIEEKDLPHVFDRFFRSDSARGRNGAGGYGLGLSIAKKIVELHTGEIDIQSTVNIGTTVIVKLPCA